MEYYAGIDVSLERSSICVVDAIGRIVREAKVASAPEALTDWCKDPLTQLQHFGGFDSRKAAEFCGSSRWRPNCGAKNSGPPDQLCALTGSATVCWHLSAQDEHLAPRNAENQGCAAIFAH